MERDPTRPTSAPCSIRSASEAPRAPLALLVRGGPGRSGRRGRGERGAAMVEFVLIIPLFLMLIFGGVTAGMAYEHKAEVVHAVRDGARYGATVPLGQCDTTSVCGSRNWAQLVQYVTAQRSDGTLSTSQICVA